jgi:hypothetical protein
MQRLTLSMSCIPLPGALPTPCRSTIVERLNFGQSSMPGPASPSRSAPRSLPSSAPRSGREATDKGLENMAFPQNRCVTGERCHFPTARPCSSRGSPATPPVAPVTYSARPYGLDWKGSPPMAVPWPITWPKSSCSVPSKAISAHSKSFWTALTGRWSPPLRSIQNQRPFRSFTCPTTAWGDGPESDPELS